jgi:serine/threonine protein kinase
MLLLAVAHDPERITRFARESRVLASLNHPHIALLYGLEKWGGVSALVIEYVDGPTLPTSRASSHRDLKPANIKVRLDDRRASRHRRRAQRPWNRGGQPINRGRFEGPPKGAHSTARPSGPATEVKVPHS